MLYLTCTTITSVDPAHNGVSHAKDWESVDCGTTIIVDFMPLFNYPSLTLQKLILICIRIHACLFFNISYVSKCYRIFLLYAYVCQRVIKIILYLYCIVYKKTR